MSSVLGSGGLFAVLALPVVVYAGVKYYSAPTPELRREAFDQLVDVVVGTIEYLVIYSLFMESQLLSGIMAQVAATFPMPHNATLAQYPPIVNATDASGLMLLRDSYVVAYRAFNHVAAVYSNFWYLVFTLSAIPITSPFGWYAQSASWYWQQTMTWTLINCGMIYAISLIAYTAWAWLQVAAAMLVIRQTRPIGTAIISFLLVSIFISPLLAAYTVASIGTAGIPGINTNGFVGAIENLVSAAWAITSQGYTLGLDLQTYDVTVDVVLALSVAAAYGINRMLGELEHSIFPL